MAANVFKTLIEKATFRFIPVYDLRDNSVYGYKIMKDFDAAGFPDKEEVYELAYNEGVLEFFILKLQEKAYQVAGELGYKNSRLFHTIRINYINDTRFFCSSIEHLSSRLDLEKNNIIFELKGATGWQNLNSFLEVAEEDCIIMFKESSEFPLNMNMVRFLDPGFIETISLETVKRLKEHEDDVEGKIIFKIPAGEKYSNEELLKLGVDLAYTL